ncbi:MAG: hypothetical protein ABR598_00430 [Candidatus Dormibacteria bacterium]
MPPISPMLVVWTIGCGDSTADVYEDGTVESEDVELHSRLVNHLAQPVDVSHTGAGGRQLVLQPGDGRHVVACVRKLVAEAPDLEMLQVRITGGY